MTRLGCYTGKIYSTEDFDFDNNVIKECTILLPKEYETDSVKLELLKNKLKRRCKGCNGCPASKSKEVAS